MHHKTKSRNCIGCNACINIVHIINHRGEWWFGAQTNATGKPHICMYNTQPMHFLSFCCSSVDADCSCIYIVFTLYLPLSLSLCGHALIVHPFSSHCENSTVCVFVFCIFLLIFRICRCVAHFVLSIQKWVNNPKCNSVRLSICVFTAKFILHRIFGGGNFSLRHCTTIRKSQTTIAFNQIETMKMNDEEQMHGKIIA